MSERSHNLTLQRYRSHMMVESEWEDVWHLKSPWDIFERLADYFQLNFYKTCFMSSMFWGVRIGSIMTKI